MARIVKACLLLCFPGCRESNYCCKILFFLFTGFAGDTCAQEQKSFDFYVVPTLGANVSYSTFQKGYKKAYYSIDRNISIKDFYYGAGLQVRYLEDFQFTVRYAGSGIGAGYKHKRIYYESGGGEDNSSGGSSPVNMLDATTEKEIFDIRFFQEGQRPLHVGFNGMIGMRYISIVLTNRADTFTASPGLHLAPLHSLRVGKSSSETEECVFPAV